MSDTPQPPTGADDRDRELSTWAHELRGPLNAILGWSDLLSTGGAPEEDVLKRGLTAIGANARRLAVIIRRMEGR